MHCPNKSQTSILCPHSVITSSV